MHTPRKILKVSVCPYHINGTVSRKVNDKVMIPKLLCAVYSVHCTVVSPYHINGNVSRNIKYKVKTIMLSVHQNWDWFNFLKRKEFKN